MLLLSALLSVTLTSSLAVASISTDPQVIVFYQSLVGASLGGFLGMVLFPAKTMRQNAALLLANLICGACFGPGLYLFVTTSLQFPEGFIVALGSSAVAASFLLAILKLGILYFPKVIPYLPNIIKIFLPKILTQLLPGDKKTETNNIENIQPPIK